MSNPFFDKPILNSPYEYPKRHWELDDDGQPTQRVLESRRAVSFITPIPKPRKRKVGKDQTSLGLGENALEHGGQEYDLRPLIIDLRARVDQWRGVPNSNNWGVTPETARLLQHWRGFKFNTVRPFFCQIEAVETAIWLTEVAPGDTHGKRFLEHLANASADANPGLDRLALKLATGAGKTTVMAMLIAWQTINAVRRPQSKRFTRGFLIVTPGITIRDRLQILQPNHPENYYTTRELVPSEMVEDVMRAKIVITNYHAFKLRERMELSKGGRLLLQGRLGGPLDTLESDGQMLQRVMPDLMGLKNVIVLNDEAHHCYREKPKDDEEGEDLKGDDRKEAEENNEAARLWISGLEAVQRKLGVPRVFDLSATPFFLRGSGYNEGSLFPWTMSDFSLMDAIECGIVKLPRVPVAENIVGGDMPMYRNLWENIRAQMPKKRRGKEGLDPLSLPSRLQTALEALYGHYKKTFDLWREKGIGVPPCFIIVCQNTAISKLVYDFITGFQQTNTDGTLSFHAGRLELFRNFDEYGNALPRPNTLLVDSMQLESGEALDDNFRGAAALEIEQFKRDLRERTNDALAAEKVSDQDILREVMNTVGKRGKMGEQIRCVVSVSMLTEGWDTSTVTHVLGVRAFGTQLLCEQVIGRALRRQSYDLNDEGLFNVEYADILGIPFDFTASPVVAPPQAPRQTVVVRAVSPERDALEIRFPRVQGYRVELSNERLSARFTEDSTLVLRPDMVGPTKTLVQGIVGEGIDLTLDHLDTLRPSTILYQLTQHILYTRWRDPGEAPRLHLFGQLKRIAKEWLDHHLVCEGGTKPGLLMYKDIADMAANRIVSVIAFDDRDPSTIKAVLDPYNPIGSTAHVHFNTSRQTLWQTAADKCHVNWVVFDSDWEAELCRVVEGHPRVRAYVKNHGLGLEVPYRFGSEMRRYLPDFVVLVDDGHGVDDLLRVVIEIKGYRREDAKEKKSTMDTYWIRGVNNLKTFGRWAFAEFREMHTIDADFAKLVEAAAQSVAGDRSDSAAD
ncbi:MAG TPA: DEAD/DEAH box helicase family protein [Gemmatimonadaceae bacterium]|nr:DEAD/DEAH box helicase family protein [Gemmatimonadaceae bacterium]